MSDSKDDCGAAPGRRRRSWSLDEKRRIVDESLEDGASLAEVARRHDLNANQLFTWRRQFGVEAAGQNDLAPILPVTIALETAAEEPDPGSSGQIEIVLADGDRILVWSDVETAALMRVLKALSRR
jgi:transposase